MPQQPNVLLIMCDQMRGDCLGIDGHPDVQTPYLDTLAADGMLFENAYSACRVASRRAPPSFAARRPRARAAWVTRTVSRGSTTICSRRRCATRLPDRRGSKMHVHPPRLGCGFEHMRLHDGYIGHYRKANLPYWMHQNVSDDYMRFLKNELGEFAT